MNTTFRPLALIVPLAALLASGVTAAAQPGRAERAPASPSVATVVRGQVFDSLAKQPLSGALVQLVSADDQSTFSGTVMSDSSGLFSFERVPNGRYTLGFFHALQDSLGLAPMAREIRVNGQPEFVAELSIPSPAALRRAICESRSTQSGSAVVTGVVRDAATGNPIAGASVAGEWDELTLGTSGMNRRTVRREATSSENGWYALCGVPAPGAMLLFAKRQRDSTAYVEVEVPQTGFLRQELSIGSGTATVRGRALSASTGQPLAGAQVTFASGGPSARADASGEFTIVDAPLGTRSLEVRAVGYYPERRTVNVADGVAPLRVAMQTYKSVIDTLKVVANYDRFSSLEGFRARARSGLGQFLTAETIARRRPIATSDLFPVIPGLFLEGYGSEQTFSMRGLTTERCVPFVYLNGTLMQGLTPPEIDLMIRPEQIIGIEVYRETQAPPQFVPPLAGCGSVVFWTR